MKNSYTLKIAGIVRQLPIIQISNHVKIASFVTLGDRELVEKVAPILVEKLPEVDILVTAEAKGIPLVYEMAKILNMKHYIVARKSIKAYMNEPFLIEVQSITTNEKQILCLDQKDVELIKGKKVALIDDVISTGESIRALEQLVVKAGAKVITKAAILAEGDAAKRKDIIFLQTIPIFNI